MATTFDGTRAALRTAVPLAKGSGAKLVVVVPRIVPYAVEMDGSVDDTAFFARRYADLVSELGGHAVVVVALCRRLDDVVSLPGTDSTIVIGGPAGRWFTSPEERFANRLNRGGRRVVFVACGANTTQRRVAVAAAALCALWSALFASPVAWAQGQPPPLWQYGGFVDAGGLWPPDAPSNHLFRNRGTTPRVDEVDVNMAAAYFRKTTSESSRFGLEVTAQAGEDSKIFGFSATAPNIGRADVLRHFGPTDVSYLAPVGKGLTIQGGIFNSLIGYDGLYVKDNLSYTRPWGADYTPYLMLGVNASYPINEKLTATAAVVNGYWHLAHANDVPSIVGQAAYKVNDRVTFKETAIYGPHQENTSIEFWRFLSDTILERRTDRLTTALEYQLGSEGVDAPGTPRALWMAAQLPVHWSIHGPFSLTVRPDFCWDRDGRWIGAPQSVKALTATAEYRAATRGAQAIVRAEYRVDDSHGSGGGFFAGSDNHLTPTQHLFVVGVILTYDGSRHR